MIRDNATYQQSKRLSSGIHRVLVNGKQVLVEDRIIVRDNGNVIQL